MLKIVGLKTLIASGRGLMPDECKLPNNMRFTWEILLIGKKNDPYH